MNWIKLSFESVVIIQFVLFILYYKLNAPYRIRRALKLSQTKEYKLLDCFSCLSFWITLATTGNIILAITIYLTSNILEK